MRLSRWLPRTLSGRMLLILAVGLLASQLASLALHLHEGSPLPMRFLWHVALTGVAVLAVAAVAVRWATRPLQHLGRAAQAFSHDLQAPALPDEGPAELRDAARAFNVMQQRIRHLLAERARALAAVSHDLRTPLTRMRLRAELVTDPTLQARLNADIDAMQAMVDSVLAYLRGLEDDERLQLIDMEALLSSLVDDERSLGRPVRWCERPADQAAPAPFTGRLSLLRRAVGNLIDNAVAHASQVSVSLRTGRDSLVIVVEDDGPGIPPADLARVTEAYVRLDPARQATGGVGLGLAIVRDAAVLHGGRLQLENRDGGGLRASLHLPQVIPQD
jgi:signal transduction histidine kinase